MSAFLAGVDLSGAFPVQVRSNADQEAEIARLTSAFAQVIERLQSEVARLERELRVERAITRHDADILAEAAGEMRTRLGSTAKGDGSA